MADIQPLHGVLYDTTRVNASEVLTQPYDKISPEMREQYLAASPYNLVRIELGGEQPGDSETSNKYTRAYDLYRQWLRTGVLRRSSQPAIYHLEQTFALPGGVNTLTRRALIARVRLCRWDEGVVLPHERTLSKPKADRLMLLRACGAQQGQIFMLYPAPDRTVAEIVSGVTGTVVKPVLEATDSYNVINRLWEITDPDTIATLRRSMSELTFYIADGHHRYETALAYRDEMRSAGSGVDPNAPSEFVMATLVDMADPGLVVLPTHRAVSNLAQFDRERFLKQLDAFCHVTPVGSLTELTRRLQSDDARQVLGMADVAGHYLLTMRGDARWRELFQGQPPLWETLDVGILHVVILESLLGIDEKRLREESNVSYWREPTQACDLVGQGRAQLAFFLRPTRVSDVKAIADARSRMPQKSTDFFPKLLSGMVMYDVR